MMKQTLQNNHKIAYQILENALRNQTLGHAYLFVGEKGTPIKETAILLMQSVVCRFANPFACEVCADCKRIVHENYADLIHIDGSTQTIKKEDILNIQQQFSQTSQEMRGKKIYFLEAVERSSDSALNALLKFLEEPQTDTIAILSASSSERVLPTIQSRCQIIQFHKVNHKPLFDTLCQTMDTQQASILAKLCSQKEQVDALLAEEEYLRAKEVFHHFCENIQVNKQIAGLFLQIEGVKKGKLDEKKVFLYVLEMLEIAIRDTYRYSLQQFGDIWGKNNEFMVQLNREKILRNIVECKDKIIRSVNIELLTDEFMYRWED